MDIVVGRVYRAKKPRNHFGLYDDRRVLYVSEERVQYNSPTVPFGSKYRWASLEKFKKWAGEDVTDTLPDGEWQKY